jgi:phospholipid-binding lipoprotein MlaA
MANIFSRGQWLALTALSLLLTSGCVSQNTPEKVEQVQQTNDPLEPMNRYFFDVNIFLEEFWLKPLAGMYNAALPQQAQNGVHNFLLNLRQPWTAVNDLLQGNPDRAGEAATRFAINSTVGVGGLFDWASGWGFPEHEEDFGQTLAVWGVGSGPYLMLPLLGPSDVRDAAALPVDWYLDPVNVAVTNYIPIPDNKHPRDPHQLENSWFPTAHGFVDAVDNEARNGQAVEELRKQSMDFYATVRSIYRQRRDAQIHNRGEGENSPAGPMSQTPTDVPAQAQDMPKDSQTTAPAAKASQANAE